MAPSSGRAAAKRRASTRANSDGGGSDEDEDDVPLSKMFPQRPDRRNKRRDTRGVQAKTKKRRNGVSGKLSVAPQVPRQRNARMSSLQPLCEVGERHMMAFLPVLPDRLNIEAVCKRWRHMSREEVSITELDFGQITARPLLRLNVATMLQRAKGQLRRLVLPDIPIADALVDLILRQRELRAIRAHRMQKKHIFSIVTHCTHLESLELLDCRALTLSGWPQDAAQLREVFLNGCNFLTNQAACSLIEACGVALEKLALTFATKLGSQIFPDLARVAVRLEELTMSHCSFGRRDFQVLSETLWQSLRWLDLMSCRGISSFPSSRCLPLLHVLILDKTMINDDGLRAIASVAPSLIYLSLQDCHAISDGGIAAIASSGPSEGCAKLELIDLKGTGVTDTGIMMLENACPKLRLVRLDSCRSVSRNTRRKYNERARILLSGGKLSQFERIFAERKTIGMIDIT